MSIKDERVRFRDVAPQLARQIGLGFRPFVAPLRLSTRFVFLDDGDSLMVLCGPQEKTADVGLALAFGLAWQGDRDLLLVLPQGKEDATLDRAAFLRPHVAVYTHDGHHVTRCSIPQRDEVLAGAKDVQLELSVHGLGDREVLVAPLIAWADAHPDLAPAHRKSYLAWHCHGRMVVKIARSKGGVTASTGVHEAKPSGNYVAKCSLPLTEPLGEERLGALCAQAQKAIDARLAGDDVGHGEHLLQARLGARPSDLGLLQNEPDGPRRFFRELPCSRPGAKRNYIDLVGIDIKGVLHIVETKIGPDEMLVLQGLDYYIWSMANKDALEAHLQVTNLRVMIDFVVARDKKGVAVGPYTRGQLDALDGSIAWRFADVTAWQADTKVAFGPPRRSLEHGKS